ncbi:alpha/beta hydrolase [Pseudacidovorax sp. NFM-22]|uniref:alpha/beta hydrolase n=1 Tax=Pseudacidovorax sp. NFM-22 TaxID=2744469 RepID=UPI001F2D6DFA|nr:alpha/beta hydrolase [Pseudacidovorax sp. NFM-22]
MSTNPQAPASAATSPAGGCAVAEEDLHIDLPGGEPVKARIYGERVKGAAVMPLVLHFHGGTFVCGDLDNGRNVGRLLAAAGARVLSLAYPLAPEHPFPKPIEVGFAALEWLYKQRVKLAGKGAQIYLAGEEAGGNLAAAVALVARDRGHPPLAGQILLSPMLDPCAGTASLREASCADAACKWATGWQQYLRRPMDATHPYAVPGSALRLTDVAPTLVLVGPDDPMRDEALAYAKRLRAAGIDVVAEVLPATSQWPEALYQPDDPGCPACGVAARQRVMAFFEARRAAAATPPS